MLILQQQQSKIFKSMQGDQLLQKWKQAKQVCWKVVSMIRQINFEGKSTNKLTNAEFMSVYDVVYKLCVTKQKQQKRITMVYKQFKQILKQSLLQMCQQLQLERDICKLELLKKIWIVYTDILKKLIHMFAYLNRPFHIKEGKIQELEKTGFDIIFNLLFGEGSTQQYYKIYFKQLQKIRNTHITTNSQILKSFVQILYTRHLRTQKLLKKQKTIYTDFNTNYSRVAREYYKRTFNNIKQLGPAQYFKEIHSIYDWEILIGESCYGMLGEGLFSREFGQQLIQVYKPVLLGNQKGLKSILKNKQVNTLKIIVQMFRKLTKDIDGFKQQFQEFVYEQIKDYIQQLRTQLLINKTKINYCNFMQKLIIKNQQFMYILQQSFSKIGDFVSYYKYGVEKAFSHNPLQVPIEEILAIYTDNKLRSSALKQQQLGSQICNILGIFNCLQSKDLFLKKYSAKLARRMILSQQSLSNYQVFIDNLKLNCGMKYTERLQTLLTQLMVSKQNQKYIDQIVQNNKLQFNINLKVFSQGVWPTQNIIDLPIQYLPDLIKKARQCIQIYQNEFIKKKTLRISYLESRIRWIYYLQKQVGNTLQQCYFDTNCLQGVLLFYIYSHRPKPINLKILQNYFQKVNDVTIRENLQLMSIPQQKLLLKIIVDDQISYAFNNTLKSKKRLINYDAGYLEEQDKIFQQQQLVKDRQIVIDANISKLMKSKKIINYQNLQNQVYKIIKIFVPTRKDIKSSVDRLICKDILKRDQKDFNIIKYQG